MKTNNHLGKTWSQTFIDTNFIIDLCLKKLDCIKESEIDRYFCWMERTGVHDLLQSVALWVVCTFILATIASSTCILSPESDSTGKLELPLKTKSLCLPTSLYRNEPGCKSVKQPRIKVVTDEELKTTVWNMSEEIILTASTSWQERVQVCDNIHICRFLCSFTAFHVLHMWEKELQWWRHSSF